MARRNERERARRHVLVATESILRGFDTTCMRVIDSYHPRVGPRWSTNLRDAIRHFVSRGDLMWDEAYSTPPWPSPCGLQHMME